MLRRRVGRQAGHAHAGRRRRHVDDGAAGLRAGEHRPQLGPHAEVGAVEVDGQGAPPRVGAASRRARRRRRTCRRRWRRGRGGRARRRCASTQASTAASSVTSSGAMPSPGVRSAATTVAPRARSSATVAAPMPDAPPVTSATLPSMSAHGMKSRARSVKSTTICVDVDERLLVGPDLLGVRGRLEEGEEAGVVVEVLDGDAVEGVAVAVVGRSPGGAARSGGSSPGTPARRRSSGRGPATARGTRRSSRSGWRFTSTVSGASALRTPRTSGRR